MPQNKNTGESSRNGPNEATNKPAGKGKKKDREERLAEALRANLKRRKSQPAPKQEKD